MTAEHNCIHQEDIQAISKDVETIKTALGYKEKSNGEFKKEVEQETQTLAGRMRNIELNMASINGKMNVIMVLMVPLLIAVIIAILKGG